MLGRRADSRPTPRSQELCPRCASIRSGLIAGLLAGLILLAQQLSLSVAQWLIGAALVSMALAGAGALAAREAAQAAPAGEAVRIGALAGLLGGLISALPATAFLLIMAFNGHFAVYAESAFAQLEAAGVFDPFRSAGWTTVQWARLAVAAQLAGYDVGLPLAGLFLGAMGARLVAAK
ncbi:MAG: hypothetical protein RMN25_03415 [Anaerolineae bacterium]|nr:hypothetical protein [Thermoflexales bacterium]MDW8406808.1 hypothetical protein [Anaerolineae bacterium]